MIRVPSSRRHNGGHCGDAAQQVVERLSRSTGLINAPVAEASSGEGALRRLERITPSAVLVSDIDLGPGMNGLKLAATVHELWPATGVLLVSTGRGASIPSSRALIRSIDQSR
jgi:CheY-like chemotaxis protein